MQPTPKELAKDLKLGTRRKGCDGHFYSVVKTSKGLKRWKKMKSTTIPKPKVMTARKMMKKTFKNLKKTAKAAKKRVTKFKFF